MHDLHGLPAPTDNCETCTTATATVTVYPEGVAADGDNLAATYCCGQCGRIWSACWSLRALGYPGDDVRPITASDLTAALVRLGREFTEETRLRAGELLHQAAGLAEQAIDGLEDLGFRVDQITYEAFPGHTVTINLRSELVRLLALANGVLDETGKIYWRLDGAA